MPKTLFEIREIARMRQEKAITNLTCGELEILLHELNRTRYTLKEQDAFIRFFMAVHKAIMECRKVEKGRSRK